MASPPLSDHINLPISVETVIQTICRAKSLSPPDSKARWELARIGEEASLQILRQISVLRVRKFSDFIILMAKDWNAEDVCTQESVCFSGPSSPNFAMIRDDATGASSSCEMPRHHMAPPRPPISPILAALGELEFRKAFLILNYAGGRKLEDLISVDSIKKLNCLPMVSFETALWNAFGRNCISESDRRKNFDWNSQKTRIYHCHVGPQGNLTFKGPYVQDTKTLLHRVLGDDNVLLVKFSEDASGRPSAQNFGSASLVYHRIAKEGICVGLRRYHFFVFKDGGKEEKKKSPTSSAVKCYFVRMESNCAVDANKPYILSNKSVHEARSIFMHVHTVSSLAKYMARFCLILSKTVKLDVDLASVNIQLIDDVPCKGENGEIVYDEDGEQMILTDGTGYISEDLAMKCPKSIYRGQQLIPKDFQNFLSGANVAERPPSLRQFLSLISDPPLLIQFRLFNNGCAVKGTLLVDKRLPPNTIHVRPSMVKVKTDPDLSSSQSCNSLEIVGTSNQPKRTCLSRSIIALLHYGGVPKEYFLELLMNALSEMSLARYNKKAALKVAERYSYMDDSLMYKMILCGVPLDEPYLHFQLSIMMKEERKSLRGGKIPVNECYYLMGTADPTGTLEPHEVCIVLENGQISGDVLVYKHPGLHFGDIHVLTATYIKDLEKIVGNAKYAIIFPTKGPRSLADEMANSDYDGDVYWVSRNPQLLEYFRASKPWTRTYCKQKMPQRRPTEFSSAELERELFQQFLINRFKPSYTISTASDCWLVFMDRLLTLSDQCAEEKQCLFKKMLLLINIYYEALDAQKSGLKVEVPAELMAEKFPHFMERPNSYHSTSVLGLIYDKVVSTEELHSQGAEIWQLACFNEAAPLFYLDLWKKRYDNYRREMCEALSLDLDKESKDLAAKEVLEKYKEMLYGAPDFEMSTKNREEIFDEALAIYQIVYNHVNSQDEKRAGACGFAWKVAGQALCLLHARKQVENDTVVCLKSVLREVLG